MRPVFAVVCDGVLYSTSAAGARKTDRLLADPRCTLAISVAPMDLVYETSPSGSTTPTDRSGSPTPTAPSTACRSRSPTTTPSMRPSAPPAAYVVFAIEPVTVRAFGTDEQYATRSTR